MGTEETSVNLLLKGVDGKVVYSAKLAAMAARVTLKDWVMDAIKRKLVGLPAAKPPREVGPKIHVSEVKELSVDDIEELAAPKCERGCGPMTSFGNKWVCGKDKRHPVVMK